MTKRKKQNTEIEEVTSEIEPEVTVPVQEEAAAQFQEAQKPDFDMLWAIGCGVTILTAVFLRFWQLTLRPLHHDEGVNGFFLTTLFRDGVYRYDPSNYHGPTVYYTSFFFAKAFGFETFPVRASVAVFGVLVVILALYLKKYIGKVGAITAGLMLALSPGMVFISRYYIHEMLFVFFSLGLVLGVLFFIEGRKPGMAAIAWMTFLLFVCFIPSGLNLGAYIGGNKASLVLAMRIVFFIFQAFLVFLIMRSVLAWDDGKPIYLLLASASAALLFATKETAFITVGTLVIASLCVFLWRKFYIGFFEDIGEDNHSPVELTWSTFRGRFGDKQNALIVIGATAAVFLYVWILFFSSFFTHFGGLYDSLAAYAFWTKTGNNDHTQNGTIAYAKWLFKIEAPIAILSAIGILIAFARARHRFALFTGLWAFGLFLAYTIIPYKTPWLALSFILPMCVIGGYAINEMISGKDWAFRLFGWLCAATAIGFLGYQTYDINFDRYDDEDVPYVYAHTKRGFHGLFPMVDHYAEKSGIGKAVTIQVVSSEYWPMPWYLKEYKSANFYGKVVDSNSAEMIIAQDGVQDDVIKEKYAAHYKLAGTWPLRPGVDLNLLVRRDLADPGTKEVFDTDFNKFSPEQMQTAPHVPDK